jgi:thiamine-phosphate pyrophosphorylase
MFFSDLTPAVSRALEASQRWARQGGAAEILPEHLLAGLLEEEEGQVAMLLKQAGLAAGAIRLRLADAVHADLALPATDPVPLHPLSEKVLLQAREVAVESASGRTIASEHLLWALVISDEKLRAWLEEEGLSLARLEAEVTAGRQPPLRLEEPLSLAPGPDEMDRARILDANANRAREALRVIEDYCRFVLDDAFLSGQAKGLRHGLREALSGLAPALLIEARDTERDVGTRLSTPSEQIRESLTGVVAANLKRLQEALRSLEEYGKLQSSELGGAIEQLRYQSYSLERTLLLGTNARRRLEEVRLYVLLSGSSCVASLEWTIAEAAAGGAQMFQLREKHLSDRELLERARQVRTWTRQAGTLFIMNDRPDISRLVEADGVHLGQDELPVKEARRILGRDALIGVSTHSLEQVRQAVLDGASYLGVGPTFPSRTKEFAAFPGLELVHQAAEETTLPMFVIGGVTADNISQVQAVGGRRVAVSQAIVAAQAPRQAAAALRQALESGSSDGR